MALVPSRPLASAARSRIPQTPWAGVDRKGQGLWLWGMQDRAGCNGEAQGDGAERPSHLPCIRLAQTLPLPLPLPGTVRCMDQRCSRQLVSALPC